ncbi:hypothetical protein IC234_02250 [Hymenobacter sp. BT189]|uniref:Uncharacterized protein n=2 Tax=Hymenobacter armeniacus TaxID=2771358 RepID=A0ABR8JLQ4_9BACT|nr:hypothetical protein [Hymenobacter armeniacus]
MQKFTWALIALASAFSAKAQTVMIDRAPSGVQNMRAVQGGGMMVSVDTVTSLDALIKRLNGNWEFVETGKAYWIGYTDDMYSIAARKEKAIEPLLDFIKTSANEGGKFGAVYSLHLIGIDSRIAGRFYEEFTNKKARQALLSLLKEKKLQGPVTHLLMRDPWQSDIPTLFDALRQPSEGNWGVVNALKIHFLPGLPIQQRIPAEIAEVDFAYPRMKSQTFKQQLDAEARHEMSVYDAQVLGILRAIRALNNPILRVEDSLLAAPRFWGRSMTEFGCKNCIGVGGKRLTVGTFLEHLAESRVQYFVEGNELVMCNTQQAQQRILAWWDAQPAAFRTQFNQDQADKRRGHQVRWGF